MEILWINWPLEWRNWGHFTTRGILNCGVQYSISDKSKNARMPECPAVDYENCHFAHRILISLHQANEKPSGLLRTSIT